MIYVVFDHNEKKGEISLRVSGHAGYTDNGEDPVCAAASILAYTFAQSVSDVFEGNGLLKNPIIKLKSGKAVVAFRPKEECYADLLSVTRAVQRGYQLLAHNHPDCVSVQTVDTAK